MKLLILLPFLFSCLQFDGEVEVSSSSPSEATPSPTFTTPAGTMDTRDFFYTINVSSIYKNRKGIESAIIYSKNGGVKIKLGAIDLKNKKTLRIRKFKDQYLVRIRTEDHEEVIPLKSLSDGSLTL